MSKGTDGKFKPKDRTNQRYGYYEVKRNTGKKDKNGSFIWEAECDCGTRFEISASKMHYTKSCGCKTKRNSGMKASADWKGFICRGFEVLNKTDKKENGYIVWQAKCVYCGQVKEFPSYYFKREHCSCKCDDWQKHFADKIGRQPLPNKQSHVNILYNHYIRGAKDRGIDFALSKEQFRELIESDCYYCGQHPQIRPTASGCAGEYEWNGIDRVDNEKGYIYDNCVPACKMCNFAKRDSSVEEFYEWAQRLYDRLAKRGVFK